MNPKEKAIEIYEKFYYQLPRTLADKVQDCVAQECALIAIDEILDLIIGSQGVITYWQEVKQEIESI